MSNVLHRSALLLGACLCAALLLGCGRDGDMQVTIPGLGVLRGARASAAQDVAYFKGVPYGKPPVGPLRWQPPQPHGPWESPRDATSFGAACIQPFLSSFEFQTSEDCLFLNVAAPAWALGSAAALPVMLWIHGDDFGDDHYSGMSHSLYTTGSSSQRGQPETFTPDTLVAASGRSVVVVTINYRLGVFGFLGSAEVASSTPDNSAGNFGIQDQRLAMAWVKNHIAAFGGDGESITIFGQSAGGCSVATHLVQPASFPFYTKAIIQSGTPVARTMASAEAEYQWLLTETTCSDLACLRRFRPATLLASGPHQRLEMAWGPLVDGVSLTGMPADLIVQGQANKVPVLMGATRDEMMSPWFWQDSYEMTESSFDFLFRPRARLAQAKEAYDPSVYEFPADRGPFSIWSWTWGRVNTDRLPGLGLGHCAARWLAKSLVAGGTPGVYVYSFDWPPQRTLTTVPSDGPGSVIAAHASEIAFVFGHTQFTHEGEQSLASDMAAYFVAFAKTADPNVQRLPAWPSYTVQSDITMHFDLGIHTQQNFRKDACDFWEFDNTSVNEKQIIV